MVCGGQEEQEGGRGSKEGSTLDQEQNGILSEIPPSHSTPLFSVMCGDPLQTEKLAKKAEKDALEAAEASEIAKIKTVFFFLPSSTYFRLSECSFFCLGR